MQFIQIKLLQLPEDERAAFIEEKREEYKEDIDIYRLASEMMIDGVIPANSLREELLNVLRHIPQSISFFQNENIRFIRYNF